MAGQSSELEEIRKENKEKAVGYIKRLLKGDFQKIKCKVNYSESRMRESDG